jgi:hypothetical protein
VIILLTVLRSCFRVRESKEILSGLIFGFSVFTGMEEKRIRR